MDGIYLITTLHIGDPTYQGDMLVIERKRSVGWYPDLEIAQKTVETNACDIYECGHYDHCLIEEVPSGLYPYMPRTWWYRWEGDIEHGGYTLAMQPTGLKNVVNFGIG